MGHLLCLTGETAENLNVSQAQAPASPTVKYEPTYSGVRSVCTADSPHISSSNCELLSSSVQLKLIISGHMTFSQSDALKSVQ